MKKFLFYLVQWTWGLPVNLVGGIIYLICKAKGRKQKKFQNAYITYLPWNQGGLSLGLFIFMRENHKSKIWTYNTHIHEYGHTYQCLLLGVFYWLIIALPSAIWCNAFEKYRRKNNVSYYVFYPEKWANAWGQKFTKKPMILTDIQKKKSQKTISKYGKDMLI